MCKMYKRNCNRAMRSISVEDLGTIVKQMINGTLEDSEQMAKLYRAIYEELYFEKMTAFEGKPVKPKPNESLSQKISDTESIAYSDHRDEFEKYAKEESKTGCAREMIDGFPFSGQSDNNNIKTTVNKSSELSIKSNLEGIETQNTQGKTVITESKKSEKSLMENEQSKDLSNGNDRKSERAFDIWRKKKMKAIQIMVREERIKKQEELTAKQEESERKRANYEVYLRKRKLLETQKKLEEMQRQTYEDNLRTEGEKNARIVANQEAFRTWLKRKNGESAQRCFQSQRCRPQTTGRRFYSDAEFDSWLDQLDSVLHQKYLRERRYRVRSFYCQPAYYGEAALNMQ